MQRCVNIDWLEVFCLEDSIGYPHNADYFRRRGYEVKEREYGTPMYKEMFTLYDHYSQPFLEIRRVPKSDNKTMHGLFDPNSCHIRLCNRTCYFNQPALLLQQFLEENGFWFQRISRIDICLDFETFDYGDEPQKFLKRFMAGKYSKINQANIAAHGLDQWDGRAWNSLAWGSPRSMVRTRFYNKTMELRQGKDKPYIRQAWQHCGLVDDMQTLEKQREDGTTYKPDIWRVEFAIKSGTKGWFVVEDYNGDRKRIQSYKNTLAVYPDREHLFQVFLSLAHHYFHFKYVEYKDEARTELQRKDRCKDKPLFNTQLISEYYQIERPAVASRSEIMQLYDSLLKRLYAYRDHQTQQTIRNACNTLIEHLERQTRLDNLTYPFNPTELEILRRVIAIRLKSHDVPLSVTMEETRALVEIEQKIWTNPF